MSHLTTAGLKLYKNQEICWNFIISKFLKKLEMIQIFLQIRAYGRGKGQKNNKHTKLFIKVVFQKDTVFLMVSSRAAIEWFWDSSNSLKVAFCGIIGWSFSFDGTQSLGICRTISQLVPPSAKIRCTTCFLSIGSHISKYHTLYLQANKGR